MVKILTIFMLLLVSTNVFAEWTWVGISPDGEITAYADLKTIRKNGNKVKMWSFFDYKTIKIFSGDNTKYLSSRNLNEFDCKNQTLTTITFTWFSENMLNGQIVYNDEISNTHPVDEIPPDSMSHGLFKIACGKRK